jgi:hypothetical protein
MKKTSMQEMLFAAAGNFVEVGFYITPVPFHHHDCWSLAHMGLYAVTRLP